MVPNPFQEVAGHAVLSAEPGDAKWPLIDLRLTDEAAFSLIFVIDRANDKVLLGTKKRGYGKGLIHGFGGKIEPGETIMRCAERELEEESGLRVASCNMQPKGRLVFSRPTATGHSVTDIAVFIVDTWTGDPHETEEMRPAWYPTDRMPLDMMWPDVRLYFPPLLESATRTSQQLLARIDYDLISKKAATPLVSLPSLQSIGVDSRVKDAGTDALQEVIVRYWMAYTSA